MKFFTNTITSLLVILFIINTFEVKAGCTDLTLSRKSTSYVTVDSNDPCGASVPRSAYLQYELCNTAGADLENVDATFSVDASSTPNFVFQLESGQAAKQSIAYLAAGDCATFYWFVSYTSTNCTKNANWHDGAALIFDINVEADDALSQTACTTTTFDNVSVITKTQNSANAGGQVLDKVLSNTDIIGGITQLCVEYSFGNTVSGGELNLQPAGNIDFNAACFQLINTEITLSEVDGVALGTQDKLGFTCVGSENDLGDNDGSTGDIIVCYYFRSLCMNTSSAVQPYSDTKSGGPHKYTGNFSTQTTLSLPATTNGPSVTKSASPNVAIQNGELITYTVQICNPSLTSDISINEIEDILPTDFLYQHSTVNTSTSILNAPVSPAFNDAGSLFWKDGSAAATFPYTKFHLAKNTCLTLEYTVKAPMDIESKTGKFTNTASVSIGGIEFLGRADVTPDSHLPVELVNISAKWFGNKTLLEWETATEENSSHFSIEKMDNHTREWYSIGKVDAAGNSAESNYYSTIDSNPSNENIYRLKIVDLDESYEYSKVIVLSGKTEGTKISAMPVPSRGDITINIQTSDALDNSTLNVMNMNGSIIYSQTINMSDSESLSIPLDLSMYPSGIYMYSLVSNNSSQSGKIQLVK